MKDYFYLPAQMIFHPSPIVESEGVLPAQREGMQMCL